MTTAASGVAGQGAYPFAVDFQFRILSVSLADRRFVVEQRSVVRPEFFTTAELRTCAEVLVEYVTRYQTIPSHVAFAELIESAVLARNLQGQRAAALRSAAQRVTGTPPTDVAYIRDQVVHWAQSQATAAASMQIAGLYEESQRTGKVDMAKVRAAMAEALAVGTSAIDDVLDYFEDAPSRMYATPNQTKIPTGYATLDLMLDGGIDIGELFCFVGTPGLGKTTLLTGLVRGALMFRHRTLVITNEVSTRKWAQRVDRAITGKTQAELYRDPAHAVRLIRRIRQVRGKLMIKGFPAGSATVGDIDAVIDELQNRQEFTPELVVVDYADELASSKYKDDYRLGITQIFRDLRALAQRRHVPVATATQATKEAINKEVVTIKNLSEATIGKAAVSDIIIALCQTDGELSMKPPRCRLFGAKYREGKKHFMLPHTFQPERGLIVPRSDEPVTFLGEGSEGAPIEVTDYGAA